MPRLTISDRWRAVGMFESGVTQEEIAETFRCSQPCISGLIARYLETGTVEDRPRSGRPRVTTPNQDRYIVLQHLRDRFRPATRTAAQTIGRDNRPIHPDTVRNRLHADGLHSRRPCRTQTLTAEHRQNRLEWCRHYRRWTRQQWSTVVFSDESRFCLNTNDGRERVWRRDHERYAECCIREVDRWGGPSVMVWGGINTNFRTELVTIAGNLTAQRYVDEVLEPHLIPFMEAHPAVTLFQQDNATPHTARLTRNFLDEQNVELLDWCSCSPDLNPIEQLWDELGRRVSARANPPVNAQTLSVALHEEWDNLPQATIRNLVNSMRRRCTECFQAQGGHTHY